MDQKKLFRRNKYCFGLGTIGRDMFYSLVSMQLMFYITDILQVSSMVRWWLVPIFTIMRVFDAFNDPISGLIVDNTRSRWGKFKPWISIGAVTGGIAMVLLFTDLHANDVVYLILFAVLYFIWDILYGLNDIAYWSMMPTLSTDQKERESIGSFARICANIGLFTLVVGFLPATKGIAKALGGDTALYDRGGSDPQLIRAWFLFAVIIAVLMLLFQAITVFGVKEQKGIFKEEEKTSIRDMFRVIFRNDQLLVLALSMSLFMIGYTTTTSFGVYYFKYVFGNEDMYSIFAAVLGVSQLGALVVFPSIVKRHSRKSLYTFSTILVFAGYLLFFFSPQSMAFIGVAGVLIFVGQAFIQVLMLMFLADTIEYGQWKSGKRNDSIIFSVQPFINKIGGALASGIVLLTLNIARIDPNVIDDISQVPQGSATILKTAMLLLPLVVIVAGYLIYLRKFEIDEKMYGEIVEELKERGDIHTEE